MKVILKNEEKNDQIVLSGWLYFHCFMWPIAVAVYYKSYLLFHINFWALFLLNIVFDGAKDLHGHFAIGVTVSLIIGSLMCFFAKNIIINRYVKNGYTLLDKEGNVLQKAEDEQNENDKPSPRDQRFLGVILCLWLYIFPEAFVRLVEDWFVSNPIAFIHRFFFSFLL